MGDNSVMKKVLLNADQMQPVIWCKKNQKIEQKFSRKMHVVGLIECSWGYEVAHFKGVVYM